MADLLEPSPELADATLISPLDLLTEHGAEQLDQVLLLTFSLDLHYLERVALSLLRATGARVTVVSDAFASRQDPRAVRWAGRSYLAGHAAGVPAFHPKLILLLGPSTVTAAIGSGNLTMPGWQRNAELWTVLRARAGHAPAALADLADWLRGLPTVVTLGPGIQEAMIGAADQLTDAVSSLVLDPDGPCILHNLAQPILDQLPFGPVDTLNMSAPFHDRRASTVEALLDRLKPQHTTLVLQPGRTRMDLPATAALLRLNANDTLADDETRRYRHGKLVEWTAKDGQTVALTGSPNLTGAALRELAGVRGNCELAVLAATNGLTPAGTPVDLSECPTVRAAESRQHSGPWLLGALVDAEQLRIVLTNPLQNGPATLRCWAAGSEEETWSHTADLSPSGLRDYLIPTALVPTEHLEPGGRYLLATLDDQGLEHLSNIVFLAGPRALQGSTSAESAAGDGDIGDLLLPGALERLLTLVRRAEEGLAAERNASDTQPGQPATDADTKEAPASTGPASRKASSTWRSQNRRWAALLGNTLINSVGGRPDDEDARKAPIAPIKNLDDLVPEPTDDPDADRPVPGAEDEETSTTGSGPGDATQQERDDFQRRLHRLAERWSHTVKDHPLTVRLIGLRFSLEAAGYGFQAPITDVWPSLDWYGLIPRFALAVGGGDIPTDSEAAAGSLIAITLTILEEAQRTADDQDDDEGAIWAGRSIGEVLKSSGFLLLEANRELIATQADGLDTYFHDTVDPHHVLDRSARWVSPDPYRDALDRLTHDFDSAHIADGVLYVTTERLVSARRAALETIGRVRDGTPAVGIATTPRGQAFAAHDGQTLLLVEHQAGTPTSWRLFEFKGLGAPTRQTLAGRSADLGRWTVKPAGPLTTPPKAGLDLLARLGVSPPPW